MRIRRYTLRENATLATGNMDASSGIVRSVKVLGLRSANRRKYLPEALKQAVPLYEGVSVRVDHPDPDDPTRSVNDVFGWLEKVRFVEGQGLFADLHYLVSHPFAKRLQEAVSRNSKLMALSHNADGDTDVEDGWVIVKAITEVRSVDLVADPATTSGLFEHKQASPVRDKTTMKLQEFLDRIKLLPPAKKTIRQLLEMGAMGPADAEIEIPPTEDAAADPAAGDPASMDPTEALRMGFSTAWRAVFDSTMDKAAKVARAKQLITAFEQLTASGEEIPEADEDAAKKPAEKGEEDEVPLEEQHNAANGGENKPDAMGKTADDDETDVKESKRVRTLNAKVALLETKLSVRDLCDEMAVKPSPALLEALLALPTEDKRRALLEERKAQTPVQHKAKTQTPGNGKTSLVASVDDFVARITV